MKTNKTLLFVYSLHYLLQYNSPFHSLENLIINEHDLGFNVIFSNTVINWHILLFHLIFFLDRLTD